MPRARPLALPSSPRLQPKHNSLSATLAHQASIRNLRAEASLMSCLRHPSVCRYLGACADPPGAG